MTRETEVVALLRQDEAVSALATGGVYALTDLPVAGITDPITTPDVWPDGVFAPTIIVRQAARIPTGELVNFKTQETDTRQRVEVWCYALTIDTVDALAQAVYGALMGARLSAAWPAEPVGGIDILDAPDLPPGTKVQRVDFVIRSIQRPVMA